MNEHEGTVVFTFEHNGVSYEAEVYVKNPDMDNTGSDMDYWGYEEVLEVYPEYPAVSNQQILQHFYAYQETNEEVYPYV